MVWIRGRLRRWSLAAGGVVALAVVALVESASSTFPGVAVGDVVTPAALAGVLTAGGVVLGRSGFGDDEAAAVAGWAAGGAVVGGLLVVSQNVFPVGSGAVSADGVALGAIAGADFGALVGYQAVRRRAEESLADAAMAASIDGIAVLDEGFRYRAANAAYADLYRVDDPASLEGDEWRCAAYREDPAGFASDLHAALAETGRWRGETEGLRPDGTSFRQELTVAPLDDGGVVVVGRDVTERHRHERRLDALHAGTRSLFAADTRDDVLEAAVAVATDAFDGCPVATWTPDEDGTLHPAVASAAARAAPDGVPRLSADSAPAAALEDGTVKVTDGPALATLAPDEGSSTAVLVPLGERALLAVLGVGPETVTEADRNLFDIFARDAAAALEAVEREEHLARREERLRTVIENASLLLYVFDSTGEITLLEGAGLEDFPMDPETIRGQSMHDVFRDVPTVAAAADRALAGERVEDTTELGDRVYEFTSQPVFEDGEVARVVGVAFDVTDRVRYQERVVALHEATRRMLAVDTTEAVCEVVVETSRAVLEQPISGVWRATGDPDDRRLEPVAAADAARDLFGDLPTYRPGESVSWSVFENGETAVFDDLDTVDHHAAPVGLRSLLVAPVGDFGVLDCGALEPGAFDETDVALANLLAANAATAIERVRRERALESQTDRMEFFNSILRHDVLNGMTVIRSRAEILADTLDDDAGGRHADTIVRWSDDVTDVVTRVRSVLETLTGADEVELRAVDLSAALADELDRVRATYPAVDVETEVAPDLQVTADELLGEVLGNLLTNAIEHNDPGDLRLRVTAGREGDAVVVTVADDGQGVPPDRREVVFRRGETGHAKRTGSGFGLFFVDTMVAAYGGEVRAEESDLGGAAFVLSLPPAGHHADGAPAATESG